VISASRLRANPSRHVSTANLVGLEERRRSAAEEDRVGRRTVGLVSNVLLERIDILALQIRIEETAVEVAVVADGRAEGDVEIKT
jgi:hypothetical protein